MPGRGKVTELAPVTVALKLGCSAGVEKTVRCAAALLNCRDIRALQVCSCGNVHGKGLQMDADAATTDTSAPHSGAAACVAMTGRQK